MYNQHFTLPKPTVFPYKKLKAFTMRLKKSVTAYYFCGD